MPDRFTLTLADASTYELNDTFRALRYDVGGRDAGAIRRRDNQTVLKRQGDGLNTPEGYKLVGIIWTDDRTTSGYNALRAEADEIKDAVLNCRTLTMTNDAGEFELDNVVGGPKPVFTPRDRWEVNVELEFWPVEEAITFTPDGPGGIM